jgi:hypothetical protein
MYKISFYQEYHAKRAAGRRALLGFTLACLLLGVALLQAAALFVSGHLLGEQVQALQASLPRLSSAQVAESEAAPEVQIARELLQVRSQRLDWTPKLAALSERILPSLRILQLEGRPRQKDSPALLELTGEIRASSAQLEAVSAFIQALQEDPRLAEDFPVIKLGNLQEGPASRFLVSCESRSGS